MAETKRIARNTTHGSSRGAPRLAYHAAAKLPIHRLPFVGKRSDGDGISFWNVPATGGYGGGNDTGGAMAMAYLRHLTANPQYQGGLLQHIVLDMCEAYKRGLTADEELSLRGQIVGFCSTICATVQSVAPLLGYQPDATEEAQLLKRANAGLAGANIGRGR